MNKKTIYLLVIVLMFGGIASAQVKQEPSVSITTDTTAGHMPLTVNFTAVVTDPFEGKYPFTYDWIFGDGAASTKKNPIHTFVSYDKREITYTVTCRVTFWRTPKEIVESSIEITVKGNIPVCTAPGEKSRLQIISDGTGGAIITWLDYRNDTNGNISDIYAQRVLSDGSLKWASNGIPICPGVGDQNAPQITSDGAGGAIITWQHKRDGNDDIYAQWVLSDGSLKWPSTGNPICAADGSQSNPQITSDGAGGAVITWQDSRDGNVDIYAQGVLSNGSLKWTSDGIPNEIPICTADKNQYNPQITSDGAGGAVITWMDYRNGNYDIYAQGVLNNGSLKWTSNGLPNEIPICTAGGIQDELRITSDGAGGAVITWRDNRDGNYDIYAQGVLNNGSLKWTSDGIPNEIPICTADKTQYNPQITSDGAGGAIITWMDSRNGNYNIYVQGVLNNGSLKWKPNGINICEGDKLASSPQIIPDGAGGAIITWAASPEGGYSDIYAQYIDSDGKLLWLAGANGVPICLVPSEQSSPQIASDGSGGAFITWVDYRNSKSGDIYAQRVSKDGELK